MKTEEEIQKTIKGMKAIRNKIVPHSMFGDDNLASFDIVLNVLENQMDSNDIKDQYDCAGVLEKDLMIAYNASDWLTGEDDDFDPVENWPLKKEEN